MVATPTDSNMVGVFWHRQKGRGQGAPAVWDLYIGNPHHRDSPWVSPMRIPYGDSPWGINMGIPMENPMGGFPWGVRMTNPQVIPYGFREKRSYI